MRSAQSVCSLLPGQPQPRFLNFALDQQVKLHRALHAASRVPSIPANCHVIQHESRSHLNANIRLHFSLQYYAPWNRLMRPARVSEFHTPFSSQTMGISLLGGNPVFYQYFSVKCLMSLSFLQMTRIFTAVEKQP